MSRWLYQVGSCIYWSVWGGGSVFVTPWTVACTKLLHPWDFLGKSTGVGCRFLLQGIFPTQGLNPGLQCCRQTLYRLMALHFTSLQDIIMEKAMAPHSSTLAWKIPWTEEPGRLRSMGSLEVGQDWTASLSLFTFMHWRRKWQPTPLFLPGESQGRGSLVGCRLWGHTESDTTEAT